MAANTLKKETKYVITAVNALTGEREVISRPHSRWKTEDLLVKARRDHARHRKQAPYSLHRMQLYDAIEQDVLPPPIKQADSSVGSVNL